MMRMILLVEDTLDLAQVIQRELQARGYQVHHCATGEAALTWHKTKAADLIILDWALPGLDGLEVLRQIRQQASTPVLMLTARDEETDRVLGLELGADDYLTKPFAMRELLARVGAILRRVELIRQTLQADRTPAQQVIKMGPLTLDPVAHAATLADHLLDLSPTEFDLLHLLVRHPGRAFSRTYLIETVWQQTYIGGDRAIDNTILRLRKKLGTLGEALETVWGVGYRWQSN